jgi:hypothetical protein
MTKKLILSRTTIRPLDLTTVRISGGISGAKGCHSIDDNHCQPPSGGALCGVSDGICATGLISQCHC